MKECISYFKIFITLHSNSHPSIVLVLGTFPSSQWQTGLPVTGWTLQKAPGPQGEGLQGSGFSTHLKNETFLKEKMSDLF